MNTRRHERAVHYCKMLKMNSWDYEDVIKYLDAYFEDPKSTDSMSYRTKILKLELDNITDSCISYIEGEERDFAEYKSRYPETPDSIIWAKVYEDYDKIINKDIAQAKDLAQSHTAAKGCFFLTYLIPAIVIIIIICQTCQ